MTIENLATLAEKFIEYIEIMNYSIETIKIRQFFLKHFLKWCEERSISKITEITVEEIRSYQRYIYYYKKEDGQPLTAKSQAARLVALKVFFNWLTKQQYIYYNPSMNIQIPKLEKRIVSILSVEEIERIMNLVDLNKPIGIRDRAILETMYSTGIRRAELTNLNIFHIDTENGTLLIEQGKGKRDRLIPIGDRAIKWLQKYINEARPILLQDNSKRLFLSYRGKSFAPNTLSNIIKKYLVDAGIHKKGSCHIFRHSMATLMLENGAPIRYIQEMLGHQDISSTQIYTKVNIKKLKEIHQQTHPGKIYPSKE